MCADRLCLTTPNLNEGDATSKLDIRANGSVRACRVLGEKLAELIQAEIADDPQHLPQSCE